MMYLPLAAGVPFVMKLVGLVWVLSALCLIFIILIQKGKGGGLSGAFGGMAAGGLLGTKTGDFLTWMTIGLVALFLILSVVMGLYMRPLPSDELMAPPAQTAPAAPTEQPAAATETVPVTGSQPAAPTRLRRKQPAGSQRRPHSLQGLKHRNR